MTKKSDKRLYFIAQAKATGICDDVKFANAWYISAGAQTLTTTEALAEFRKWLQSGEGSDPHYTAEHMKRLDAACRHV